MDYITTKRFKRDGISGHFNIPYGTAVKEVGGSIFHEGREVARITSAACHKHFARNDDGRGLERGKLTQAINDALRLRDGETNDQRDVRWGPIFNDALCQSYRRREHADSFLWNHNFYNAPIEDLRHIATLIGSKED